MIFPKASSRLPSSTSMHASSRKRCRSSGACAAVRHSARAGESSNAEPGTPPRTAAGLYARRGKRVLDVVGASLGILLLLPLTACVALMIRLLLGSPVLFRQRRPGLHGEPFVFVKFRSMTNRRDASGKSSRISSGSRRSAASCAPPASMKSRSSGMCSSAT